MMDKLELEYEYGSGDHLSKINTSETIKQVSQILAKSPNAPKYDRPEDDGQSLLAHKTPGSVVLAKKYNKPSRERHSGD